MATVTVGDLLDSGKAFDERVEACYAAIRDRSADNGTRLLTYYLARNRRRQDATLSRLPPPELEQLRRIAPQTPVVFEPERAFHVLSMAPEAVTGPALLEAAVNYDQALVRLYRAILHHPVSNEAREVLEALVRFEERDMAVLRKMQEMHYF